MIRYCNAMRLGHSILSVVVVMGFAPFLLGQDLYDRGVVRTIELQFAASDWHQQLLNRKAAGLQEYFPADMTVDGVLYPSVGVRYKGNHTFWTIPDGQKKPLHIDLDEFGVDQDIYGHSKLVLNNQAYDSSIMREIVAYRVMNQFIPSPRACFVKIIINGVNYGIYSSIEHIGKQFCESRFGDGDGFRYKAVPPWAWPDTIDPPPPPQHIALQDIGGFLANAERAYEIKNNELDPDRYLGLLDAIDALTSTSLDLLVETLEPLLDTDLAIWHLGLNNMLGSLDAYYSSGQNYYLYQDSIHRRIAILPWDFNLAFGVYGSQGATMSPTYGKGDTDRPLYNKLVNQVTLRQEYLSHMNFAVTTGFDPQILHAEIDDLATLIDAEVQSDTRLGLTYVDWKNGVADLKSYIDQRYNFLVAHHLLDVERPNFSSVGHFPNQPTSADRVRFFVQVDNAVDPIEKVTVHVRTIGGFHSLDLFDDGLHGDGAAGDNMFAVSVPELPIASNVEYYFQANCEFSNGVSFAPGRGSTAPLSFIVDSDPASSDVLLNEFVARNQNGPVDEAGQHEDWIELYNHGVNAIDVSGMWLSDNLRDPLKWQIPAGNVIAPNDTLLIWADNDPQDGPLHANFKLSSSGEDISLMSADGTTFLDFHTFGFQQDDISTARITDGDKLWVTLSMPTPDALNQISCGARAYNALDGSRNIATLAIAGIPSLGANVDLQLRGFPGMKTARIVLGTSPLVENYADSDMISLVGDIMNQFATPTDASGNANIAFTIPTRSALTGRRFFLQAAVIGPVSVASNGLEVVICP